MAESASWVPEEIDREKPSAARVYDYILGGGHNFAADRELAGKLLAIEPNIRRMMLLNRAFLRRAVLFLMSKGIRQFLDLGSGIPTVGNVHEVAHKVDPATRVMYVDYEDVAVAHSELILAGQPNAAILRADATQPDAVLDAPVVRDLIDFTEPVGLLAVTLLHYVADDKDPVGVTRRYLDVMVPGTHLALTHGTTDFFGSAADEVTDTMRKTQDNVFMRPKERITEFFDGLELLEPGLVPTSYWRPETPEDVSGDPSLDGQYAGVGRKN